MVSKAANFGLALAAFAVFAQQVFKVINGIFGQVRQVVFGLLEFGVGFGYFLVCFKGIELGNSFDADLGEANDVVFRYITQQLDFFRFFGIIRIAGGADKFFQALVNRMQSQPPRFRILRCRGRCGFR